MITVILAEDEALELAALERDIDYASLGMQVIATASDGKSALNLLKTHQPDILISDIVMPKLSGLELLRITKEQLPDTHVILISGHQRFDFAQIAIEYGVEGFLTKPLFPEQVYDILKNIAQKIQKRNRRRFEDDLYNRELEENLPLLREVFVRSLIEGTVQSNLESRLSYYRIALRNAPLSAMCILPEEHSDITKLSLRRCVTAFFEQENRPCCFANLAPENNSMLCVLYQCTGEDTADTVYDLADRLRLAVLTEGGFAVSIGTSPVGAGLPHISTCAANAKQALDYRFYMDEEDIISYSDIASQERLGSPQQIRQLFPSILEAIDKGDSDTLDRLCAKLYYEASICSLPPHHLRILFTELMSRIISSRCESDPTDSSQEDLSKLYTRMLRARTLTDMVSLIKQELDTAQERVGSYLSGRKEWLVRTIKDIIHAHYAEDLTIDAIAGQAFISTGYATRLFRQYTGESINSYLTQIRMNAAAELLKTPTASISDTATKVGYTNVPYFSSVFRKKFGYTPREWRDMHAGASEK